MVCPAAILGGTSYNPRMLFIGIGWVLGGSAALRLLMRRLSSPNNGRAVAGLRPLPCRSVGPAELIARRKRLPRVDPDALRRDIDTVLDPSL